MNAVMLHQQYGRIIHDGVSEHKWKSRCKLWPPFVTLPATVATKRFGLMTSCTFAANSQFAAYTFHFDLPSLTTHFSFVKRPNCFWRRTFTSETKIGFTSKLKISLRAVHDSEGKSAILSW